MSGYTSALADAYLAASPTFYWPMDELSGDFVDRGPLGIPLNVFPGAVTRGTTTVAPGDPNGKSVSQDKATEIVRRANNVIYDAVTPGKLGVACWTKLSKLTTLDQYFIYKQGSYALFEHQTRINMNVDGQTGLSSDRTVVVPDAPLFIFGAFDSPGGKWRIYVNGGVVAERTIATNLTALYATNAFYVGGQVVFGAEGVRGAMQHTALWLGSLPSVAQIRAIYQTGAATLAEQADQAVNVNPWSTTVRTSGKASFTLENNSDAVIYVALGDTAFVGGGIRLQPGGFREVNGYTGPLSAIHGLGTFGSKLLGIS